MQSKDAIEIKNISFKRGDRYIFDKVNLKIPRNKITAIMGPSGTGKTTLLNLITGQIMPNTGTIKYFGTNITELSDKQLFNLRKKMGMLFQHGALLTDMSVYDNIAFPLRKNTSFSDDIIDSLVKLKLEAVGLRGARDLMPQELSGGMMRRVALARAIALEPEAIFYDEPFSGQDPISMKVLMNLIQKLNRAIGITSVIVSHDIEEVLSLADYAIILNKGNVMIADEVSKVKNSNIGEVKQFLGGKIMLGNQESVDKAFDFHYQANDLISDIKDFD